MDGIGFTKMNIIGVQFADCLIINQKFYGIQKIEMEDDEINKADLTKCPDCYGHGWIIISGMIKEVCQRCLGKGVISIKEKFTKTEVPISPYD